MLDKILNEIPDYKEFLTTEEMDANSLALAEKYPEHVKVESLGKSRKGSNIYCLTIGSGSKNVFMFGCPHPNEPMGAMMVEYLSERLATDDAFRNHYDFTWHFIKSIDIDGTKLNEGWFKGDLSLTKYARNFFRPAGYEQVEWTYPFNYKGYEFNSPLPETQILMDKIDELQPEFVYSLHNAGFGGTYWYISKEFEDLWEPYYESSRKQEIPLHLGEPEVNFIQEFAPAIFPMLTSKDTFDYYESFGDKDPKELMGEIGTSTEGYLQDKNIDGIVLVTELPYFYDSRIESDKLLEKTRKESYLEGLDYYTNEMKKIDERLEDVKELTSDDNPFYKMVEVSVKGAVDGYETAKAFVEGKEEYQEQSKESEDFDSNIVKRFYNLLSWGLAVRSCEHELEKDELTDDERKRVENVFNQLEKDFYARAKECEEIIDYEVIPIKKLVSIQLESGLLLMEKLQEESDGEVKKIS